MYLCFRKIYRVVPPIPIVLFLLGNLYLRSHSPHSICFSSRSVSSPPSLTAPTTPHSLPSPIPILPPTLTHPPIPEPLAPLTHIPSLPHSHLVPSHPHLPVLPATSSHQPTFQISPRITSHPFIPSFTPRLVLSTPNLRVPTPTTALSLALTPAHPSPALPRSGRRQPINSGNETGGIQSLERRKPLLASQPAGVMA